MSFTFSPVTSTGQVQGKSRSWRASCGLDEIDVEKYLASCRCAGGVPMPIDKSLNDLLRTRKEKLDSTPKKTIPKDCYNAPRSGTWQFMSSDLLINQRKQNTLQDDLESFFWVILYTTIRYLNTSLSHPDPEATAGINLVAPTISIIFDTAYKKARPPFAIVGGAHKEQVIMRKAYITRGRPFAVIDNPPMTALIDKIIAIIRQYQWTMADLAVEMDAAQLANAADAVERANADAMIKIMGEALRKVGWPIGDYSIDHRESSSDTESIA